jgi:hypothetical protein
MSVIKVLFIDDNRIDNQIDKLRKRLKDSGLVLDETFMNLGGDEFKIRDEKKGIILDFAKIKGYISKSYFNENFDVVASDYDYSDRYLDGYTLLKWIINVSRAERKRLRKARFCLYSTQQDKLVAALDTPEKIRELVKLKIDDFIVRDRLPEEVSSLIQKPLDMFDFQSHIVNYLYKYPDYIFKHVYSKFRGKTLGDIAHEIDAESPHGIEFQRNLAELTLAHLIELNNFGSDD